MAAQAKKQSGDSEKVVALPTALSVADASIAKGMLGRGDRQHDIAAWFGVNAGRVADVATGRKHKTVPAAPEHSLPPPGPYSYFTERPGMSLADQFRQAMAALDIKWVQALAAIREELHGATVERKAAHAEARQLNEKLDMLLRQNFELRQALNTVDITPPRPSRRNPGAA